MNKNIVLCFDGTGDWVGVDETNVAKIFAHLDREEQLCFYDGGVGTLSDPRALLTFQRVFLQLIDLATATSLRDKVLQGYGFLVRNYEPDDRIFLFGFSRGAFTARVLAGMIKNFGLLLPESGHLAPYLWQATSSIRGIGPYMRSAARIRRDFCRPEKIEIQFMGLFDTVSSVGVLRRFNTYPNTDRNDSVKRTCHAVAIDEQRNAFPESLMHPLQQNLTEVWFPGVHRDIGGGVAPEKACIADEALRWIAMEAQESGLLMADIRASDTAIGPQPNYPDLDPYVFLGLYPMRMFTKRVSAHRFYWPNFSHERLIPENALIHSLAYDMRGAPKSQYRPKNWPCRGRRFETGSDMVSSGPYEIRKIVANVPDLAGITFGVSALFLLWNWMVGEPFGSSWPWWGPGSGWWMAGVFAVFILCQAVRPGASFALRAISRFILPTAGILSVPAAMYLISGWRALEIGYISGLALFAISQLPWRWPVMRADRVLPYVAMATVLAAFTNWVAGIAYGQVFSGGVLPTQVTEGLLILFALIPLGSVIRDRFVMAHDDTKEVTGAPEQTKPDEVRVPTSGTVAVHLDTEARSVPFVVYIEQGSRDDIQPVREALESILHEEGFELDQTADPSVEPLRLSLKAIIVDPSRAQEGVRHSERLGDIFAKHLSGIGSTEGQKTLLSRLNRPGVNYIRIEQEYLTWVDGHESTLQSNEELPVNALREQLQSQPRTGLKHGVKESTPQVHHGDA